MRINKLNYEAYMIDYIEGTLSQKDRQLMDLFLNEHPELKEEINIYLEAPIFPEDIKVVFAEKHKYLKAEPRVPRLIWIILILMVGFTATWYSVQSFGTSEIQTRVTLPESTLLKEKEKVDHNVKVEEAIISAVISKDLFRGEDFSFSDEKKAVKKELKKRAKAIPQVEQLEQLQQLQEIPMPEKKASGNYKEIERQENNSVKIMQPSIRRAMANKANETFILDELKYPKPRRQELTTIESLPLLVWEPLTVSRKALGLENWAIATDEEVYEKALVSLEETPSKRKKWWNVLVSHTYKDMDLGNVVASATLQSAAEDLKDSAIPVQLITH